MNIRTFFLLGPHVVVFRGYSWLAGSQTQVPPELVGERQTLYHCAIAPAPHILLGTGFWNTGPTGRPEDADGTFKVRQETTSRAWVLQLPEQLGGSKQNNLNSELVLRVTKNHERRMCARVGVFTRASSGPAGQMYVLTLVLWPQCRQHLARASKFWYLPSDAQGTMWSWGGPLSHYFPGTPNLIVMKSGDRNTLIGFDQDFNIKVIFLFCPLFLL